MHGAPDCGECGAALEAKHARPLGEQPSVSARPRGHGGITDTVHASPDLERCNAGQIFCTASAVPTRRPRVPRVLAEDVEYITEVEADCTHAYFHPAVG